MKKKELSTRVARWILLLEEFDYVVEHRSGSRMRHVDSLSRHPVMTIIQEDENLLGKIRRAQEEDEWINLIKSLLKKEDYKDYFLKRDMVFKFVQGNELLVIPEAMRTEIIKKIHEKGHYSVSRTEEIIKQQYHFPHMKKEVGKVINSCVECTLINKKAGKQEGFLNPLPKGDCPLRTYHCDHLGPLESTNKNYQHILVIIDAFSKFTWLYPTKSTTSREVIDRLELQKKTFGNPEKLIVDRGTAFRSDEFRQYCEEEKIELHLVTTGLPRSNGQVERINRCIIPILSKLSLDDSTKWYKYVGRVQQILNSSYHRSIKRTPFEVLFGTKIRMKEDLELRKLLEEAIVEDFLDKRADLREEAKTQIAKVQEENKRYYNLRRRVPTKYKLNDLVAIKRTQQGPGLKLRPKFLGPYRIIRIKDKNTYDVIKEGIHEGPKQTTTCAEYMKKWEPTCESSSESDAEQDSRV